MSNDHNHDDLPFYAPGYRTAERQPEPGLKVWKVTDGRRTLTCELRDDGRRSAGVDVQILEDDQIVESVHCRTAEGARFVANAYKRDHLRQGWTEIRQDAR